MSILAHSPDLKKIIKKAVERIGENHSLARDDKGVTLTHEEIQNERKETTERIEESLKAAADEMAAKMVLENTIDVMVKDVINEQAPWPPKPTYEETQDLKQIKSCINVIEGYEYTQKGRSPYVGGTFMTEFMWHLKKSFDQDAENAKEIEYKIKQCFRNTVFWDEYGKVLRFLGDDRNFRRAMKDLERGPIKGDRINVDESTKKYN